MKKSKVAQLLKSVGIPLFKGKCEAFRTLCALRLTDCNLRDEALQWINEVPRFSRPVALHTLDVSSNPLTTKGMDYLLRIMYGAPLQYLSFESCYVSSLSYTAARLETFSSLVGLNIGRNPFDAEDNYTCIIALAETLPNLKVLAMRHVLFESSDDNMSDILPAQTSVNSSCGNPQEAELQKAPGQSGKRRATVSAMLSGTSSALKAILRLRRQYKKADRIKTLFKCKKWELLEFTGCLTRWDQKEVLVQAAFKELRTLFDPEKKKKIPFLVMIPQVAEPHWKKFDPRIPLDLFLSCPPTGTYDPDQGRFVHRSKKIADVKTGSKRLSSAMRKV